MLSELAQYMAVFYFNMRTVHFNTAGKNFLELHEYAQELYEQAEDYYDDLVETALSFNETVQPMFVTPGSWIPVNSCPFNVEETINTINSSIRMLFDFLESIAKEVYPSFVYSKIDSMLEWLDKQNYKLTQMSKEI
jgi:DNA-binding ferritin-like protein